MAHKERHTAPKKKGGAVKILLAVVLLCWCWPPEQQGCLSYNEIHGNGKPGTEVTVSIPPDWRRCRHRAGEGRGRHPLGLSVPLVCGAQRCWVAAAVRRFPPCRRGQHDAIIAALSTYAKADTVRITIPEGTTAIAIARKMEEAGLCSAEDFQKEANEGDFSARTPSLAVRSETRTPRTAS